MTESDEDEKDEKGVGEEVEVKNEKKYVKRKMRALMMIG